MKGDPEQRALLLGEYIVEHGATVRAAARAFGCSKSTVHKDVSVRLRTVGPELFRQVQPHDLLKFGIIPELVGRLPVITSLQGLGKDDLVRILTEPKNALCKQYHKLLAYDQVELSFEKGALEAIAEKAIERQIGARGLRAIMEEIMTKIMYEIPSDPPIQSVCITERCVREGEPPQITRDAAKPRAPIKNAGVTL